MSLAAAVEVVVAGRARDARPWRVGLAAAAALVGRPSVGRLASARREELRLADDDLDHLVEHFLGAHLRVAVLYGRKLPAHHGVDQQRA
eukprot:CAMPEP_0195127698 /NCGR_PEP_ID=MMETSP0448-20130528/137555_1 /TAXON_ID=66468 /ORGANISM="Heterocapsa triquestra, Strain CCMP 448" /LENGTH=88 /DNA_ID=CAMNT_0040165455 /DNA_START=225 /DNA_END=488 /DNA_ORIENTATION=+